MLSFIQKVKVCNETRTPGEWEVNVQTYNDGDDPETSVIIKDSQGEDGTDTITICDDVKYYPQRVARNDMHFIALAPQMAEALLKIKTILSQGQVEHRDEPLSLAHMAMVSEILTVINKGIENDKAVSNHG